MRQQQRPVFLQLQHIHLPVTGLISITHRISGALLFFSLPLWLWLLQQSLASEEGYSQVVQWLTQPPLRLLLAVLGWWFLHHLLAGLRVLLLDGGIGVELPVARRSALVLMWLSLLLLLFLLLVALL